jgi:transcriptional regulator with XRE-family HTH domain
MPLLEPIGRAPYAPVMAKKAAPQGDNPWGEAIRYWLKEFKLRQTHISEATGIPGNTISKAARGLDVHQHTLRRIAEFFQVPFASVLVSPERRLSHAEEQHVVEQLAADARRVIEQRRQISPSRRVDPMLLGLAKRIEKLPLKLRKSVLEVIATYEKQAKDEAQKRKSGGGNKPFKK